MANKDGNLSAAQGQYWKLCKKEKGTRISISQEITATHKILPTLLLVLHLLFPPHPPSFFFLNSEWSCSTNITLFSPLKIESIFKRCLPNRHLTWGREELAEKYIYNHARLLASATCVAAGISSRTCQGCDGRVGNRWHFPKWQNTAAGRREKGKRCAMISVILPYGLISITGSWLGHSASIYYL